jgi:hypothetical protein
MTALEQHCNLIKKWCNFEYSNTLITEWTRFTEEDVSESLRVSHMVRIVTGMIEERHVLLPHDWLELDFVRLVDGKPIHFMSRDEFYDKSAPKGTYTITGNFLITGGDVIDGVPVEISYYQKIPPLEDDPNWMKVHYKRLYLVGTLSVAEMFGFNVDKSVMWEAEKTKLIEGANLTHIKGKASGSLLKRPTRKAVFG